MPTVAIGIPKEANNPRTYKIYISPERYLTRVEWENGTLSPFNSADVGYEDYSILGKLSELTDEQLEPHVYESLFHVKVKAYKNYLSPSPPPFYESPKESFISKLKSEGKICKFMAKKPISSNYDDGGVQRHLYVEDLVDYSSLPDDLLILILK